MLEDSEIDDHVPTFEEVLVCRNKMESAIKSNKNIKGTLQKINENVERDREIHDVDRQVKELGEKFDYYMF
jgi:DNA-binding FrmR family transcriptional regulator